MLGDQHAYSSCRSFILRRHTRRISGFLFPFGKKAYISPFFSSLFLFLPPFSHMWMLCYSIDGNMQLLATLHSLARNNHKESSPIKMDYYHTHSKSYDSNSFWLFFCFVMLVGTLCFVSLREIQISCALEYKVDLKEGKEQKKREVVWWYQHNLTL